MSIINTNAKEIHCKILYYGPKGAGKKSSILYIKENFKEDQLSFFSLPLEEDLYALVLNIGKIFNLEVFFHIYNFNISSKMSQQKSLESVDGIVFVASRDLKDQKKNKDSLSDLENFFQERNKNLFQIPLVFQYNKSDQTQKIPLKILRQDLNKYNNEDFQSSVLEGKRVLEPLKYLGKLILNNLKS